MMIMSSLFISKSEVEDYLTKDTNCSKDNKVEVLGIIGMIDSKRGRKWVFTPEEHKYYIDEYNEYNDLVKTIIVRL